jgi:hypothetical protein
MKLCGDRVLSPSPRGEGLGVRSFPLQANLVEYLSVKPFLSLLNN